MIILCVLFRKYSFVPKRPLVLSVCLSVCLFVCHSPTGHNLKPIFKKLHHLVEFVTRVCVMSTTWCHVHTWLYLQCRSTCDAA